MQEFFNGVMEGAKILLSEFRWNDLADIIIIAFIFYKLLVFIRDSRAQLVFKALLIIFGAYLVAYILKLQMVSYMVDIIIRNAAIALLFVFQPEIRNVLERIGRSKLSSVTSIFNRDDDEIKRGETLNTISNVVECTRVLQRQGMGALIVFEREVRLNDIVGTGTLVDAMPNVAVIANIFFNKAPLHDGAVIIRDNRVCAAGCILPLTQNNDIDPDLGTRHRAAIGMSENSDAVVVVVSEETGRISVTNNGVISSSYDPTDLSSKLMNLLLPQTGDEKKDPVAVLQSKGRRIFKIKRKNDGEDSADEK